MECKEFIYKTCPDGTRIPLDVYYPVDAQTDDKKPIAMYIHGGGWISGSKSMIAPFQLQQLLGHGFIAVSIDYRLCPTISVFDGAWTDTRDAYTWCRTELPHKLHSATGGKVNVDGEKVVVIGSSAGGTLALLTAQCIPKPRAILDMYGIKSFSSPFFHKPLQAGIMSMCPPDIDPAIVAKVYEEIPPPTSAAPGFDVTQPRMAFMWDVLRRGKQVVECTKGSGYASIDPMTLIADKVRFPPVMVLHGTADDTAPIAFSMDMVARLKKNGDVAELIEIKGLGHGFDAMPPATEEEKGESERAITTGCDFLKRYA